MATDEIRALSDSLWLTFKLKEQSFAVDAGCIHSIFQMPESVERIHQYPDMVRGVMSFRGQIVPMLDLRIYLSMPTVAEEYVQFTDMLEARKQDHIRWVDELKRCVEQRQPFLLATDPHKCAFGKWYDHFHTSLTSVGFHMAKISEPHSKLHASAVEALSCNRECNKCTREECLQSALRRAEENYMPRVVGLLEEAKSVFLAHFREMCIVIADGDRQLGLIVDEVLSAAPLEQVGTSADIGPFSRSEIVRGVAHCATVPGEILMMDTATLFGLISPLAL